MGDVRIGDDGAMYVWQGMAHRLVVFGADGRRKSEIGGRGAGPGEFLGRVRWTWMGDTLAAFDSDQQRYSLYRTDGAHVRTGRILPEGSIGVVVLQELLGDGSALGWPRARREEGVLHPRLRFSSDGVLLDTLLSLRPIGGAAIVRLPRGVVMSYRRPIEQGDLYAVDPRGAHGTVVERTAPRADGSHTFRVYRIGRSGDTIFDRRFRYTSRPVDTGWADSVRAAHRERWSGHEIRLPRAGGALTREEVDLLMEALALPEFHPPVTSLGVGRDGSTWLRRAGAGRADASWLVLDGTGQLIARLTAPAALELRNADGGHVWGVLHDALDVPYLVRYRIVR